MRMCIPSFTIKVMVNNMGGYWVILNLLIYHFVLYTSYESQTGYNPTADEKI